MIVLKNGQRYLAVVLEHQPGSHVRVRLMNGRPMEIRWETVAEMRPLRPEEEARASAEDAAALSTPSVAPGPPDAWVRAHLLSEGLRLESTADSFDSDKPVEKWAWSFVCDSPCGDWVSRQRAYRLRPLEGLPTSRSAWSGRMRRASMRRLPLNSMCAITKAAGRRGT